MKEVNFILAAGTMLGLLSMPASTAVYRSEFHIVDGAHTYSLESDFHRCNNNCKVVGVKCDTIYYTPPITISVAKKRIKQGKTVKYIEMMGLAK